MPRSTTETTGISGSGTVSRMALIRSSAPASRGAAVAMALPDGVGIGARQELHRREQMAEMLAVMADASAARGARIGRQGKRSLAQHRLDPCVEPGTQCPAIDGDAIGGERQLGLVHVEHLFDWCWRFVEEM